MESRRIINVPYFQWNSQDYELGVGNFIFYALGRAKRKEEPTIFFDCEEKLPSGSMACSLSLVSLVYEVGCLSAWYHEQGIERLDCIGLYMSPGIQYLLHTLALNALGAVPVYANGKMRAKCAMDYFDRMNVRGVIVSQAQYDQLNLLSRTPNYFVQLDRRIESTASPLPVTYPYVHQTSSPVLISHTSGTTGNVKGVVQRHGGFMFGILKFLEDRPVFSLSTDANVSVRYLSVLPAAHNSFLAYSMRALLTDADFFILTAETGSEVVNCIQSYQPHVVVAFALTYQAILESMEDAQQLASVSDWINTGDAAHEPFIRRLTQCGRHFMNGRWHDGSFFHDGLGSSEMGSTFFRATHRPGESLPLRCIGRIRPWFKARILGDDNELLRERQVGKLAVQGPTVTTGYWNDLDRTQAAQIDGYWLTGDMVYCDAKGYYYHVDRVHDVINVVSGKIYTVLAEEVAFAVIPALRDCVVLSARINQHVCGVLVVILHDCLDGPRQYLREINRRLQQYGCAPITYCLERTMAEVPRGVTGKVLKRVLRREIECLEKKEMIHA